MRGKPRLRSLVKGPAISLLVTKRKKKHRSNIQANHQNLPGVAYVPPAATKPN
jgi:hypothetical protein